ncbi:MAG TPA: hypothetical protein VFK57_11045 [Vicinamibacterales bacterium]|nr:hypothetical protein [Vicinamibacterales bacterium]
MRTSGIADQLPPHFRPLLTDARTIYDLQAVGREAAAFLMGIEVGRRMERQYLDPGARVRPAAPGSSTGA